MDENEKRFAKRLAKAAELAVKLEQYNQAKWLIDLAISYDPGSSSLQQLSETIPNTNEDYKKEIEKVWEAHPSHERVMFYARTIAQISVFVDAIDVKSICMALGQDPAVINFNGAEETAWQHLLVSISNGGNSRIPDGNEGIARVVDELLKTLPNNTMFQTIRNQLN